MMSEKIKIFVYLYKQETIIVLRDIDDKLIYWNSAKVLESKEDNIQLLTELVNSVINPLLEINLTIVDVLYKREDYRLSLIIKQIKEKGIKIDNVVDILEYKDTHFKIPNPLELLGGFSN